MYKYLKTGRLKRNVGATFPTPSGITESRARDYCRHTFMSASLYSKCQHSNILAEIIDGCVEDIKVKKQDEYCCIFHSAIGYRLNHLFSVSK